MPLPADVRSTRLSAMRARRSVESGDPARATISAIARSAGVSRLTVYRHFPDELSLLVACTSTYNGDHPLPDFRELRALKRPADRLNVALTDLYAYYSRNQAMLSSGAAAAATHPELLVALAPWFAALRDLQASLAADLGVDAQPGTLVAGALGHALSFLTWQSLRTEQGLTDAQAVALMASLVMGAVRAAPRAHPGASPAASATREAPAQP